MLRPRLSKDHCHDGILIGRTPSSVFGKCGLEREVCDNVTTDDNKVASDEIAFIEIAHRVADGGD